MTLPQPHRIVTTNDSVILNNDLGIMCKEVDMAHFRIMSQTFCADGRKVKAKLILCLTKHHAMKIYWGVEVKIRPFLTLRTVENHEKLRIRFSGGNSNPDLTEY
jgi:hypothetical protein